MEIPRFWKLGGGLLSVLVLAACSGDDKGSNDAAAAGAGGVAGAAGATAGSAGGPPAGGAAGAEPSSGGAAGQTAGAAGAGPAAGASGEPAAGGTAAAEPSSGGAAGQTAGAAGTEPVGGSSGEPAAGGTAAAEPTAGGTAGKTAGSAAGPPAGGTAGGEPQGGASGNGGGGQAGNTAGGAGSGGLAGGAGQGGTGAVAGPVTLPFQDDFERETLGDAWTMVDAGWVIDSTVAGTGSASARNAVIGHEQTTGMSLTVSVPELATVSFRFRISSEEDFDWGSFLMDGTELGSWSGTYDWQLVEFLVPAGDHELTWQYRKDFATDGGDDSFWIDDLTVTAGCSDGDSDGVCDLEDPCPLDDPDDADGDGVCESDDVCPGYDDRVDDDADGFPNGCDLCLGSDASGDSDSDGTCDIYFWQDDFETGTMGRWWTFQENGWFATTDQAQSGTYSAQSDPIIYNQTSSMSISVNLPEPMTLSFWVRVSSEEKFDYFRYSVDRVPVLSLSGEFDWTQETVSLDAGAHTIEWVYEKDIVDLNDTGADAAWVDNIVIAP